MYIASVTEQRETERLRSCVKWEVGLASHSLFHSSPVPKKPYGFCGRKAPWKKKKVEEDEEEGGGGRGEK